jgi:phage terminase large subunit-like protein
MAFGTPEFIKKPNSKVGYTKAQIEETLKCASDPLYFLDHFMWVQHPVKGKIPFKTYPYQKELINAFFNYKDVVVLFPRQAGKTICAAGYLLWYAMFNPDSTILVAANKFKAATEIMDRIKFAYEELPNHIKAGIDVYNVQTIKFDNGSRIVSTATSADSGRGMSITLLYCLAGESTVTVRNKITGEIEKVSLIELKNKLQMTSIDS